MKWFYFASFIRSAFVWSCLISLVAATDFNWRDYTTRRAPDGFYYFDGRPFRTLKSQRYRDKYGKWRIRHRYYDEVHIVTKTKTVVDEIREIDDDAEFALAVLEENSRRWQQIADMQDKTQSQVHRERLIAIAGLEGPQMQMQQPLQSFYQGQGFVQQPYAGAAVQTPAYAGASQPTYTQSQQMDLWNANVEMIVANRFANASQHSEKMTDKMTTFMQSYLSLSQEKRMELAKSIVAGDLLIVEGQREAALMQAMTQFLKENKIQRATIKTETTQTGPPVRSVPATPPPQQDAFVTSFPVIGNFCYKCHKAGGSAADSFRFGLDVKLTSDQALQAEYAVRLGMKKTTAEEIEALRIPISQPMPPAGSPQFQTEQQFAAFLKELEAMTNVE